MSFFKSMDISASGLTAQSFRMDVIAQNIANSDTTRTADGTPYQRRSVVLSESRPSFAAMLQQAGSATSGVEVAATVTDNTPGDLVFNPAHPDADEQGYVHMPNVDITREYVDMIAASRAYEANLTVISATKRLALKALDLGR